VKSHIHVDSRSSADHARLIRFAVFTPEIAQRFFEHGSGVQIAMQALVVARIFASLLIVLSSSPLTAPFATCDLATFFDRAPVRQAAPFRLPPSDEKSAARAPGSILPTLSTVGPRVRLLTISGLRVSPASLFAVATLRHQPFQTDLVSVHSPLVTNLRL
jgi:hypothetical protein